MQISAVTLRCLSDNNKELSLKGMQRRAEECKDKIR